MLAARFVETQANRMSRGYMRLWQTKDVTHLNMVLVTELGTGFARA